MCRLLETIKVKNGVLHHIDYHNKRLNDARRKLWNCEDEIDLSQEIKDIPQMGFLKCRVLYEMDIKAIEYSAYLFPEIHSLQLLYDDDIDYKYKYENRQPLKYLFDKRKGCDDILLIKNGLVTDTYFCNVVFEKAGYLYTPSSCLLNGIKRQYLLDTGIIKEREIKVEDISRFDRVFMINALIDLEDNISVDIGKISL